MMKGGNTLQLTVAILKPDLVARPRDLQVYILSDQRISVYHTNICTASGAANTAGRFLCC